MCYFYLHLYKYTITINYYCLPYPTEYLGPVVRQLESVAVLSVKSQVLYMTGLTVSPEWSPSHHHYALPHHQLPLTINAIEAKLGNLYYYNFGFLPDVYKKMVILYPLSYRYQVSVACTCNDFFQ